MSKPLTVEDHLRVCVFSFMFFPLVGGAEMQAIKHAHELQARGHDVTILTLRHNREWKREETIEGIRVVRVSGIYRRNGWLRIGRSGRAPIDIAMFLKLWQLRHQYDVVHFMQMSSVSVVATLVCQLIHKPIVISIQSAGPNEEQKKSIAEHGLSLMADTLKDTSYLKFSAKDWIAGDIENLAHSVIGGQFYVRFLKISHAYYQVLSNRCRTYLVTNGFRPEQIARIPNGIDPKQYQPAPARPDPAQPEREILCVARMEYPKGVDVLVHAWARMMNASSEWRAHLKPRLRLVGRGIFRPQIERMAAELGVQDSIEFMGLRRDIIDLLQHSWGFVLPSRWEGMPNALLEAMSCGLPCVATRVSGSEDLITDGINGLLVEPEQPAEMAQALRRLIEDTALAQKMAQEARATVARDYHISSTAERCLQLYHQIHSPQQQVLPLAVGKGSES